jgi:hypothetical protein
MWLLAEDFPLLAERRVVAIKLSCLFYVKITVATNRDNQTVYNNLKSKGI